MRRSNLLQVMVLVFLIGLSSGCLPAEIEKSTEPPINSGNDLEPQPISQEKYRPLILVHYMPWYQTQKVSGSWGWHWTMNHFNPRKMDENGKLPIASHYYPLTGPYDSGDRDLLEYQVMLMKLSGIDGVIVDWYGFERFWDYGKINVSTHRLFEQIKKAGLLFAITYEDRTIQHMLENGHPNVKDAHTHGKEVMLYLQENWFTEDTYLKYSGRPVLFVFGNPSYFSSSSDWEELFSVLDFPPVLVTQDGLVVSVAESGYPWPPMHLSGGNELARSELETYLDNFYKQASSWDFVVASAFPGFHDIYKEAGVGPSYGYLDANDGETFEFTLQKAIENDPDILQVVTWNDYGEGTNIEPTLAYEYQYLEMIQRFKVDYIEPEFPFTPEDFPIPLKIFNLRKEYKGNTQVNIQLDKAVDAVLRGRLDVAQDIIESYQTE